VTHDRWTAFWVILALISVGLTDTLWRYRAHVAGSLAAVWAWVVADDPAFVGRHAYTPEPRPGARTCDRPAPHEQPGPGSGDPQWHENDDDTLACTRSLPRWGQPEPLPQVFHEDRPPRFVPAVPATDGSFVGLAGTITADDDTHIDLPRPVEKDSHAASGADAGGPGQPYHPHAGPPAWRQYDPWTWNGHTWIRQAPAGAAWIDHLCTMPLRQLEAAA
jgi:hypothetical protein